MRFRRFRGLEDLEFEPGLKSVLIGPQNAGKSTVLEGLDLLMHSGFGRRRPPPNETDYFNREVEGGFQIEAVIGSLSEEFLASAANHIEGWHRERREVVPQTDGDDIEPVVRVRVRGTDEFEVRHEFAKPESQGAYFNPAKRLLLGWVYDGRAREPSRQLAFFQGGVLEQVFADVDLGPATALLRDALSAGSAEVNAQPGVAEVLSKIAEDLTSVGLVAEGAEPRFESGAVSQRELLQSLRLALPTSEACIPIARQGRGAQRLILLSFLLRLARMEGQSSLIAAFEEPEEALEPLRQGQVADMLAEVGKANDQVFVVTHSPEIVRRFELTDLVVIEEGKAQPLSTADLPPLRQGFERWLDGALVRGLFARVPVLVEGPSDRAVFEVFWSALAADNRVRPAAQVGVDPVNCEGVRNMKMQAGILRHVGKKTVVLAEQDNDDVKQHLANLRSDESCAGFAVYPDSEDSGNLEGLLSHSCTLEALVGAMSAIAIDRGYTWPQQRADLLSRAANLGLDAALRQRLAPTEDIELFFGEMSEVDSRKLISLALQSKSSAPFDLKGGRQARLFASQIVESQGVPPVFAEAFVALDGWVAASFPQQLEHSLERD